MLSKARALILSTFKMVFGLCRKFQYVLNGALNFLGASLFRGARLLFLPSFPEGAFIPEGTFIPYSRVDGFTFCSFKFDGLYFWNHQEFGDIL